VIVDGTVNLVNSTSPSTGSGTATVVPREPSLLVMVAALQAAPDPSPVTDTVKSLVRADRTSAAGP
jgi:hypothetical protein